MQRKSRREQAHSNQLLRIRAPPSMLVPVSLSRRACLLSPGNWMHAGVSPAACSPDMGTPIATTAPGSSSSCRAM